MDEHVEQGDDGARSQRSRSRTRRPRPSEPRRCWARACAHEFGRAFAIGVALNTGFVVVEAIYGVTANSIALLADAGHNLSDVLGLLVAWAAAVLSKRIPTARYTYGMV
jgi:Co/Zn/Cd efflux system component